MKKQSEIIRLDHLCVIGTGVDGGCGEIYLNGLKKGTAHGRVELWWRLGARLRELPQTMSDMGRDVPCKRDVFLSGGGRGAVPPEGKRVRQPAPVLHAYLAEVRRGFRDTADGVCVREAQNG